MTHTVQDLEAALPTLPVSKQSFAASLIEQSKGRGLSDKQMFWVNKLVEDLTAAPKAEVVANVGDLSAINVLFDKARQHLRFPAIVMSIPAAAMLVRINVAGNTAKHPGTLNVTSGEKPAIDTQRAWYGRVMKDGAYVASSTAGVNASAISERLIAFARDPAGIASEHGRLTGRCCFCNKHLQDERSTAVGYGKTCAGHFGLPWGVK
jgi:hypothetical protein